MANEATASSVVLFHKLIRFGFYICGLPTGKCQKAVKWSYFGVTFVIHTFLILGSAVTSINTPTGLFKLQATTRLLFGTLILQIVVFVRLYKVPLLQVYSKFNPSWRSGNPIEYVGDDVVKITARTFISAAKNHSTAFGVVMAIGLVVGIMGKVHHQDVYDFMYLYLCGPANSPPVTRFCISQGSFNYLVINEVLAFVFTSYQSVVPQVAQLLIIASLKGVAAMVARHDELSMVCVGEVKQMQKSDTRDYLRLKQLVKYQQSVIRHIHPIRSNLHLPIVAHVITLYVFVIFYVVPIASQAVKPMYLNASFVGLVSYLVYLHYTVCDNWQTINSAQAHFCDTLLEFPWYERDMKFQKLYLMALQLNQRNDPLTIFGLYEVNLKFFSANMNRLYTIVNLLLLKFNL